MKIKIEIDVPEYTNSTQCIECPFRIGTCTCELLRKNCGKFDFSRMEIKELEENNESKS